MPDDINHPLFTQIDLSIFKQVGTYFSAQSSKNNANIPFKDHAQFAIIVDSLIRKQTHHVILQNAYPALMQQYFLAALALHLAQEFIPNVLRHSDILYLDVERMFCLMTEQTIERDLIALQHELEQMDRYLIIALPYLPADNRFQYLLHHPRCRLLSFSGEQKSLPSNLKTKFTTLSLASPQERDIIFALKQQSMELEHFHEITIPDELLTTAYSLTARYLSTTEVFTKTLLLLDSSAARASIAESGEIQASKLTLNTLLSVLSSWTRIPLSHLQIKFRLNEFMQHMQQHLFGQDAAISMLGHGLQQAHTVLQQRRGLFASFIFAGAKHCGKRTTALALAEYLFKQPDVLYIGQIHATSSSILEIKVQRHTDKKFFLLRDVIQQTPYAMLMLDLTTSLNELLRDELSTMAHTGELQDKQGNYHCFQQAIFLFNTTAGQDRLADLANSVTMGEQHHTNLMQLIMDQQKVEAAVTNDYSAQDIADAIRADINQLIPLEFFENITIMPFFPLNQSSIEKIIRSQMRSLGKMLDARYNIELGYAPEVIRYLTEETCARRHAEKLELKKTLRQLYLLVEQIIAQRTDDKDRSNQLFLQLNETGKLLRGDWLTASRQHSAGTAGQHA